MSIDKSNFRELSTPLIAQVIKDWKQPKFFTFEEKQPIFGESPISKGEYIFRFKTVVKTFFCQGTLIPIELTSGLFHTTTLSENPLSDNHKADATRLKEFLKKFDEEFYQHVQQKIDECEAIVYTSDPIWMKL